MRAVRAVLRYLRVEDEAGLHVGVLLLLFGVASGDLAIFALALLGFHVEQAFRYTQAKYAMRTAHEQGLARRTDAAEALDKRMAELETKVKELATPERLEATRMLLDQMKRAVPGMRAGR